MTTDTLFKQVDLGAGLILNNRLVMAPLTRCMADDELVPTQAMAEYYARRADTGLIITEATLISQSAQGYPNTPGLYNQQQVDAWKAVTQRVHQNGGKIFAQLWHTGRVSHSHFLNGEKPLAPSALAIEGHVPRMENLHYGEPQEMTPEHIKQVVTDFGLAAANAKKAGFDGVEIHGANGYLIDQFLHYAANEREDEWGQTPENMSRLLFDVIDVVKKEIEHVGVRLSPAAYFNMAHDAKDVAVFDYVLAKLNSLELAYVHTGMFEDSKIEYLDGTVTQYIRKNYHGTVIASGGYSAQTGEQAILRGDADLIAIGRPLIANPDYIEKVKTSKELTEYDDSMLAELI